jgi:hypothetical protein
MLLFIAFARFFAFGAVTSQPFSRVLPFTQILITDKNRDGLGRGYTDKKKFAKG